MNLSCKVGPSSNVNTVRTERGRNNKGMGAFYFIEGLFFQTEGVVGEMFVEASGQRQMNQVKK